MDEERMAVPIPEAARRLSCSPRTVQRLIDRGTLRAVKVGRVWRIPVEGIHEFLGNRPQEQKDASA